MCVIQIDEGRRAGDSQSLAEMWLKTQSSVREFITCVLVVRYTFSKRFCINCEPDHSIASMLNPLWNGCNETTGTHIH